MLPVLEVAIKYGIELLESRMRAALFSPSVVKEGAMKLFVVAYQHRWEQEMRVAARNTLYQPVWKRLYVVELESITGGDLHRLQQYRLSCTAAATKAATTFGWLGYMPTVSQELQCLTCEDKTKEIMLGTDMFGRPQRARPGGWWVRYVGAAAKELAKRPFGSTVMESELVDAALQQASTCQNCSQNKEISVQFKGFCKSFAAQVEWAVSQVSSIPIDESDHCQ
jgi:hypothetical protein